MDQCQRVVTLSGSTLEPSTDVHLGTGFTAEVARGDGEVEERRLARVVPLAGVNMSF
jgi:hypothetical protein